MKGKILRQHPRRTEVRSLRKVAQSGYEHVNKVSRSAWVTPESCAKKWIEIFVRLSHQVDLGRGDAGRARYNCPLVHIRLGIAYEVSPAVVELPKMLRLVCLLFDFGGEGGTVTRKLEKYCEFHRWRQLKMG